MTYRLLDTFCKAGGAGMGYHLAGFEVVGIDIEPQKHYPFEFHQADALEYIRDHGHEFDAIHASPPCQHYSTMTAGLWKDRLSNHPQLVMPVRELIEQTNKPYVIENVTGAPLINAVTLCGSMFGLKVRRHRKFETSFMTLQPDCRHKEQTSVIPVYGHSGGSSKRDGKKWGGVDTWKDAMGIDWMTGLELAEAIPPAYTRFIGEQLMAYLEARNG